MLCQIDRLRRRVDEIDDTIIDALARRFAYVDQLSAYKRLHNLPLRDDDRERDLLARLERSAVARGLDRGFISGLFRNVLAGSRKRQVEQMAGPRVEDQAPAAVRSVTPVRRNGRDAARSRDRDEDPCQLVSRHAAGTDTAFPVGDVMIGTDTIVIAGPCAVESREQIMECARAVREAGGSVLRGGCYKPRTSPYSFQGLGSRGLELLREAGDALDLPVITEVMDPRDVEEVSCLADILQIGARSMQNFPLLREVGQSRRPVMLKRGAGATITEWLGAAEYILRAGNDRVVLCERGIRTFETTTRNTFDPGVIPAVRERTHLPVMVDPSHAAGFARWVGPVAMAALAAGAQGIMVEIHPDPAQALSDGKQSLSLDEFHDLMTRVRALLPGLSPDRVMV